jgi:microcystin-dependent protein
MSEPTIGTIKMFGGNFAPRSWALCQGQLLPINQNQSLYSILGTTYGGDGRTTFALPDLRGRAPIHEGTGPGLTPRPLGQRGGSETNTLTNNNLASHNHIASGKVKAKNGAGDESNPGGGFPATAATDLYAEAAGTTMASDAVNVTINNNGGQQPVNNMQPYLVVNYIICLQGLFPSRN